MDRTRRSIRSIVVAVAAGGIVAVPPMASADSPPPSWTNLRDMTCDGVSAQAAFAPGGVFTSFHVIGSSDVIVPKHVEVIFPDETEPFTSLHVPGFDGNKRPVVTCEYVDPEGLQVTLVGVRG